MRENVPSSASASVRIDERLREAGHALEQHVAAGEQAEQQPVQHLVLADQDLADLGLERGEPTLELGDVFGELVGHMDDQPVRRRRKRRTGEM